jgi:chromosome segregation ATPase
VQPLPTPTSIYSQAGPSPALLKELRTPSQKVTPHSRNSSAPVEGLGSRNDRRTSRASGSLSAQLGGISKRRSSTNSQIPIMTSFAAQPSGLRLRVDGSSGDMDDLDPYSMPRTPRSPPRKMSNFFGWKNSRSPGGDSPSTNFSERSSSLPVSPMPAQEHQNGYPTAPRLAPPAALDVRRANAAAQPGYYVPQTPSLPTPPVSSSHMAELERELQEISAELANSIKREMELEDEVERARSEPPPAVEGSRRTSDYYSDSGAGSVRYPLGDNDGKIEQLERLRRTAEQEKAQLKLDMSQRLQDALRQRREIEEKANSLHEHLRSQAKGQEDAAKVQEMESAIGEAQRKLSEERQFRENFQDLVAGMREEIEQYRLERDNLRDEVVPQLQSRIDGLEHDATNSQTLTYEHTRMQQELQAMKDENQTLLNARRVQADMQQQQARFGSITEEGVPPIPSSPSIGGLTRSKSFANRGAGGRTSRSNSASGERSLSRAESVKEKTSETREALAQKVKDIESQRDALHKALKSLLDRHVYNEKQQAKRLKLLEKERDRFMSLTPRRSAFHTEVKHLKEEVTTLRRRGDEALDQKWRCEKGLGGLKMDLDRANQETASLRALLQERDIFVPDRPGSRGGSAGPTSSGSLDKAYSELRTTQALSIARIRDMESGNDAGASRTLELLKQSISDAENERDRAQVQAEEYRQQAKTLRKSELEHLTKEKSLASELYASAQRMDELADQVQIQLLSNSQLRQKLAEAIERGEKDQKSSSGKISQMQRKLRELEDKLMAAQQHSEETVNIHEAEAKQIEDAHNSQLQRATGALLSPRTPLFAMRSPKLDRTTSGAGISIGEATKTAALVLRVQELEKALTDADKEMGEVVSRMNLAQMEVAELQSERYGWSRTSSARSLANTERRDEAMMRTRRLQTEIVDERSKVKQLMSKSA